MVRKPAFLSFYLLLLCTSLATAQQGTWVTVHIENNSTGEPVGSATVQLGETTRSTASDGSATFESIPAGLHTIKVSAVGFVEYTDSLTKYARENLLLSIPLSARAEQIESVTVTGSSANQKIKQAPIRSVFIDTRAVSNQAVSLTELMNRSTGIRVRQNGGIGSRPEISVNGFQGKAIKYFKDGIPIDYLGDGYNLSALPVEMFDHMEIYKGVLPVSLGADALGGALNFVSANKNINAFQGYYEIGSFSTHRLGVRASRVSKDQRWGYGGELYVNYAKNDYQALVSVTDPQTRNTYPERVNLFNNAYKHLLAEAYLSIKNRTWTDELKFSLTGFGLLKEQQHPALMTTPYGALHSKQHTIAPSVHYKLNLLDEKMRIDHFSSFNVLKSQRIDTLKGSYDWFGNFTPRATVGESRLPSDSRVDERQWVNRTNISYLLSPSSKLEFNHVATHAKRKGEDPLGPTLQGTDIDVLSLASSYNKQVFGLSWEQALFGDKLENQLMGKYYVFSSSGYQNTWFSTDVTENDKRSVSGNYWGITEALKYNLSPSTFIRGSVEYAYRLPERDELFGNSVFVVPNFELTPEKSWNVNLGLSTKSAPKLTAEVNAFYRNTEGLILLVPIQAPNAQYQNQENVRGYGLDLDLVYRLTPNYTVNANATWQDLRLFGISSAIDAWKNDARLRNTPYFFANAGASGKYGNVFAQNDKLNIFANYNFTREFYLETIDKDLEPGGFLGLSGSADLNSSLVIPNQHLLSAGATYNFSGEHLTLGAECKNLLNKDIYDYYRVPRPGRSFHLKLSYKL
ncbi:MAG: TonB-dependent receptor [Sphingobacterium sp.]